MRSLRLGFMALLAYAVLSAGLPPALVSGAAPAASPAAPAAFFTINVATPDDIDPNAGPGPCSLRGALQLLYSLANGACGPVVPPAGSNVTIKLPPLVELSVPNDLPAVYNGDVVNISGPGVIDGGSQNGRHNGIFHIVGGTLNLKSLTLQHGSRPGGGAIWLGSGTFIADSIKFDSNDAAADPTLNGTGGAINVDFGALTVTKSIFINNVALDAGGAVSTDFGYFSQDRFLGNVAAAGGAFEVDSPTSSPVVVIDSRFINNMASPQKASEVPGVGYTTHGDSNGGGAVQNNGNLLLARDVFGENGTQLNKGGAGFSNEAAATAQVIDSVFIKNLATAQGNGSSNSHIDYSWGGGIYNAGTLDLIRVSLFKNQADFAGAIFNHLPGNLSVYNSTVTDNIADHYYGGLVNENPTFDPAASQGAEIHLNHATIGRNTSGSGTDADDVLSAMFPHSVWFANTILYAGCNLVQYTVGRSVMTGECETEADPSLDPLASGDISMTSKLQIGLQPLAVHSAPVDLFMTQEIDGDSIAAAIGRDDPLGCGQPLINHKDQNLAPRPASACSAGAYQASAVPAQFTSNPVPGTIRFPPADLTHGALPSVVTLTLENTGGGAFTYQLIDHPGSGVIAVNPASPQQGTLLRNQQAQIGFTCQPPSTPDEYWHAFTIQTDAPNQPEATYGLVCDVLGPMGLPGMDQMPGPYNMPMPLPGQTAHAGVTLTNYGHMSMTASPALANQQMPWGPPMTSAPAGSAPASPAATLNPGQSLHVDVPCTPTSPGVFLNTLSFTTSDPNNPAIQYDLACEGQVPTPPEPLQAAETYNTGVTLQGVSVSPDGAQVLDGHFTDNLVDDYTRDPASGSLSANGSVGWPGMSAIQVLQYSHDGQNVYYTSANGNGIVMLTRAGPNLSVGQVLTAGTTYICGLANHIFVFCPIGTMYGADGLAVSPDDQYVYVVGYYDNSLTSFQRQSDGQLNLFQTITGTVNGLGGPVRVSASPDGQNVYVASYNTNTVAVFGRGATGRLNFLTSYTNGFGGLTELAAPADLVLSPDGNFVYVTASSSGAVDVFRRSSADGGLILSSVISGVTGVWGVAITHDEAGRRLFISQTSGNVVQVYGRDQASGALSYIGGANTTSPSFLAVSPDNQDVYASLSTAQAVRHLPTVRNVPVLSHLSPATAIAGGSAFTLTAGGGRYYPNSQIVWAGTPLATVFVSEQELQASVSAGLISAQQNPNVLVRNAAPGGGDSNALAFAVTGPAQPPVPSIESLDPPAASFGGGDLVVLVHGANFAPNAAVTYNGVPVPTLFLNAHLLQITLSADILDTPGDGGLVVTNGGAAALSAPTAPSDPAAPVGSTAVSFRVNPPGVPAAPALTRLAPSSAVSGSVAIWVTVTGYNFSASAPSESVGLWNGLARPSVVIDAHTLLLGLTRADLATAGYGQVTVQTPGYGTSKPLAFRVRLPNEKPIPVLTGFGVQGWTLVVLGSDFVSGAQISLNGAPRATTFVNAFEVTATLTAADRAGLITVTNPTPGGGVSNPLVAFIARIWLPFIRR